MIDMWCGEFGERVGVVACFCVCEWIVEWRVECSAGVFFFKQKTAYEI